MFIGKIHHLTYCTNIHPGETWNEVFDSLKNFLPAIKKNISPDQPFGIGLRLSELASRQIMEGSALNVFKQWLQEQNLYVFTLNGFPYGGFHGTRVKDEVHRPDWTTQERVRYTMRLASILAELLPDGMEGSISTSPISYKPWYTEHPQTYDLVSKIGSQNVAQVLDYLDSIAKRSGKIIHLDLEPEPDGLIENTEELISFVRGWLLPYRQSSDWSRIVQKHFQVCYDVCHFAIEFEDPAYVFSSLRKEGIKIGKIQLSAALKADLRLDRQILMGELQPFAESTYLHQVIERQSDGSLKHFQDLPQALAALDKSNGQEWRTHFHVPLFVENYQNLSSTQYEIRQVLALIQEQEISSHLEIETYTWEVLPDNLRVNLQQSIERELAWVIKEYQKVGKKVLLEKHHTHE